MRLIATATAAATAVLLGACAPNDDGRRLADEVAAANATVASGNDVVHFELADMAGDLRSEEEWAGQPLLLNFWATWCAPCRREIPLLKETQDRYSDIDLQVIGIAVDFREDVLAYAEEARFNYPVLIGQEDAMAVAESSGVEFIGLPFTMVVAGSGELVKTHIGEIESHHIEQIAEVLASLRSGDTDLAAAREKLGRL